MGKIIQATTIDKSDSMEYQIEDSGPTDMEDGVPFVEPVEHIEAVKAESATSCSKLSATIEPTARVVQVDPKAATVGIRVREAVAWVPLTEFNYFPKLPFELRNMIFVIAVKDSSPRILAIQPQYREHPGLIHACKDSREVCTKYYYYCASKQRCKNFRFFIDYQKDVLYLNHPFTLLGGRSQQSPLQATHSLYPEFLELIETLAMNLKEVRNLSGEHRGKNTLWLMLSKWCPNLKELRVVVNNFPANGLILKFMPIKTTKQYDKMIEKPKQRAGVQVISNSFKKAQTDHGFMTHLKMRLVLIDESAGKVKSKKERADIAEAWKKANIKVDGVSEVDRLVAGLDSAGGECGSGSKGLGGIGKGPSDGTKKDKKSSEASKSPVKHKKAAKGKLAKKKAGKPGKKSSGKAKPKK
ncbi:hypothetical protein BKA64DRAFT_751775 [Cadophora sp. MPI-SDFR-AT-0126]|nr:hypothetical protein BKA64DRAFT_751775 [Leotiomycetes sp. MPI-SDFR-AT-0126]